MSKALRDRIRRGLGMKDDVDITLSKDGGQYNIEISVTTRVATSTSLSDFSVDTFEYVQKRILHQLSIALFEKITNSLTYPVVNANNYDDVDEHWQKWLHGIQRNDHQLLNKSDEIFKLVNDDFCAYLELVEGLDEDDIYD